MSRFRRRLMGLAALRQAKADDYVRVEYIENTSNAYIDTKVFPNNNTNVEIRGTISTTKRYIFGARTAARNRAFGFYGIDSTNKARWDYGNQLVSGNFALDVDVIYKISNNKNVITVYNESTETSNSITATNNTFTCQYTMYYFGVNQQNVLAAKTSGKLYYLKIYNGSTLVRDYIPMYQISKDTYGLWDRVTEEFYTSPNGVKFTGGARVIADDDDNIYYLKNYIYINSTQTQYIILKPFTENDNVELKVHPIGATNYWFGDRTGSSNTKRLQIASWNNTRLDIARNQFPSITYSKGIINKDITLKLDGKQFYVNNELLYTFTSTLSTTNNTNLGRVYNTGRNTNSRFYWFKWWNKNKDLIYDLIPVQRCSDNVWGFFDKVSLVFHPSNGTAQFTGG